MKYAILAVLFVAESASAGHNTGSTLVLKRQFNSDDFETLAFPGLFPPKGGAFVPTFAMGNFVWNADPVPYADLFQIPPGTDDFSPLRLRTTAAAFVMNALVTPDFNVLAELLTNGVDDEMSFGWFGVLAPPGILESVAFEPDLPGCNPIPCGVIQVPPPNGIDWAPSGDSPGYIIDEVHIFVDNLSLEFDDVSWRVPRRRRGGADHEVRKREGL